MKETGIAIRIPAPRLRGDKVRWNNPPEGDLRRAKGRHGGLPLQGQAGFEPASTDLGVGRALKIRLRRREAKPLCVSRVSDERCGL